MADFNSKYTGEQVEQLLDQVASGNTGGGGGITVETDPIFSASPAATITEEKIAEWDGKQDKLVSGTNIKTINGTSLLGSGNIVISGGEGGGSGQSAFKRGIVEQTQTWTKAADGGYDYTMSNLVEGDIPIANIDLFEAAGAVFNETSGYFELHGLTDISYQEMMEIYKFGDIFINNHVQGSAYTITGKTPLRTILSEEGYGAQSWTISVYLGIHIGASSIESIQFYSYYYKPRMRAWTNAAYELDTIQIKYLKRFINVGFQVQSGAKTFNAPSLEEFEVYSLKVNLLLPQSSRLKASSVAICINNEAATSAITITLHPTAYARAIADSDVQAALQAHTNVTLASA